MTKRAEAVQTSEPETFRKILNLMIETALAIFTLLRAWPAFAKKPQNSNKLKQMKFKRKYVELTRRKLSRQVTAPEVISVKRPRYFRDVRLLKKSDPKFGSISE